MDFLILFSFFITPGFAAAPPVKNDLASLSTPGLTLIRIYKASVSSQEIMWVPDNGTFFNPNPAASLIKRVCISSNLPACAFGATNGTWIAAYNNTNHGCSTISPPLVFNIGFCCLSLDDCALLDGPFALRTRFTEVAKAHLHDLPNGALNLTKSSGNVSHINVPTNGTTFSFGAAGSHISQVCLGTGIGACMFQAADGMAYTAWAFGGCVNVDPTKGLDNGFCCKDLYNCGTFNLPRSVRDVSLQTRGKVVNNSLAILFEGPPDIAAWELVLTNLVGFNVTDHVSWSVGQVCLMSETALCAFTALDGSTYVVIGGQNGNCAVVGPPQVLVDGCCCNAWNECDAPTKQTISQAVGAAVIISISGANATNTTNVASNSSLASRQAGDVTLHYYGTNEEEYQLVTGNWEIFESPSWAIDQVCMISPDGYCGLWSVDLKQGFQLGPPAAGASSACHTMGPPYVLGGGICCKTEDSCYPHHKALPKRSIEPSSARNTDVESAAQSIVDITLHGDPVYYPDGNTFNLFINPDVQIVPLLAFAQPVAKICVNKGFSCQFFIGEATGPFFYGGTGGCQEFDPSIIVTSVICILGAFKEGASIEPISIRDTTDVDSAAASTAHITFYGDPAVYVEDGGVTTVLQLVADAHVEQLISFGEPVVKLCVDTPTTCQFYIGTAIGPSFYGATGGCQVFNPSITLTSVQCIDAPFKAGA